SGRLRRDHDRDHAGGSLLVRRGLSPAIPRQGAQRVLRTGRHGRYLPDWIGQHGLAGSRSGKRGPMHGGRDPQMPSDVVGEPGFFDRFAQWAGHMVSRAPFFAFCVVMVVVWLPSVLVIHDIDTWQLIINTATTIVTFLLVALLQNSQTRADKATQHKLNAIADGLADLMERFADDREDNSLRDEIRELRSAVGLEDRESTSDQG